MNAIWAIVVDTWRQSKQQVVFLIMLILMLLVAGTAIVLPKSHPATTVDEADKAAAFDEIEVLEAELATLRKAQEEDDAQAEESGERDKALWQHRQEQQEVREQIADLRDSMDRQFGLIFLDDPADFFAEFWVGNYAKTLAIKEGRGEEAMGPMTNFDDIEEAERMAVGVSKYRRGVETYIYFIVSIMVTISMYLFIAACSGYFPGLLASGAVDVVLAKPLTRLKLLLGKYFGGIALFGAAIAIFNLLVYVGVGLRTGVFVERIFLSMPLQIFTAGVLYAILALVGILFRSTGLATILGFFLYAFVDTAIGTLMGLQQMGMFKEIEWMDQSVRFMSLTFPNFSILKDTSLAMLMNVPTITWTPYLVATGWLVGTLGWGYFVFRRRDY